MTKNTASGSEMTNSRLFLAAVVVLQAIVAKVNMGQIGH